MMCEQIKSRDSWMLATAGTFVFAAIYECFSHQVYSQTMILAFLYPLLGGLLPTELLLLMPRLGRPGPLCRSLWGAGIAALTVGSVFRGILEIYGTTSRLSQLYTWVGLGLAAMALLAGLLENRVKSRRIGG